MILTGHQPTYLPWLGLFNKISNSDCFVLFDNVQYLPKEWMNRNKIKTPNGEIFLNVPVLKKSFLKKKIYDIKINNNLDWKRKHLKSIKLNYSKAKFYNHYIDYFEEIYSKEWIYLSDLNYHMLKLFLKLLNINVKLLKLSDLEIKGKKSELVLNLCLKLNAKKFIFGQQGSNYADIISFKKKQIKTIFQNYNHPSYYQLHGKFVSNLSIIDLLFNCGNKSLEIINYKQNI
tara:strand:+ start:495 stop:1187 length:693 start_codon:yes stop_codon:yes gene_type:complete